MCVCVRQERYSFQQRRIGFKSPTPQLLNYNKKNVHLLACLSVRVSVIQTYAGI